MSIPAKNGNDAIFQLSSVTLPDGSQAQAVVLVGADGNPIASWPLPEGAATDTTLAAILAKLNGSLAVTLAAAPLPTNAATDSKLEAVRTLLAATLSVSVSNFPATQAVTGTFWQATQPVSVASLPLPSGAATAAVVAEVRDRLPASPHAQPLTDAQLRATPVPITGSISVTPAAGAATEAAQTTGNAFLGTIAAALQAEDSAASSGALGVPMLAMRADSDAPTADDGDWTVPKLDEEGRLKVATKPASILAVVGVANTVSATVVCDVRRASNVVFHVRNIGSVTLAAGTFVFEGSIDSTDGTDGTWFGIQAVRSNANIIETSIALTGITAGNGYAASWEASVNGYSWMRLRCSVAVTASASAQWTIKRGSYATEPIPAAQASATQPVSGTVTIALPTSSPYVVTTTASTNAATMKGSAGSLLGICVSNPTATAAYVKLYNKASAPTVGTDAPLITIPVPAGAIVTPTLGPAGMRFATGIAIAVTGGQLATDTTNAVAGVQIMGAYV